MAEKIDFPGCGCFLGTGSGLIRIIHKIIGAVPAIIPYKQKAEKCYQCSKYTAFDTESAPFSILSRVKCVVMIPGMLRPLTGIP